MPSTYLELTNQLLRQFNEVELKESNFASAIGVHALAKDCVRNAVSDINHIEYEWPFNSVEVTQTLTIGTNEYTFPENMKYAEWESFFIVKNDTLSVSTSQLRPINKEEWYKSQRQLDLDAGATGLRCPQAVFPSSDGGFGVSPSPDKAYQIKYNYFKNPSVLSLSTDLVDIPTAYDNVIIMQASPRMEMFRNNAEGAAMATQMADKLIGRMRGILINKQPHVYDGRVNLSRYRFSGGYINVG